MGIQKALATEASELVSLRTEPGPGRDRLPIDPVVPLQCVSSLKEIVVGIKAAVNFGQSEKQRA
jgi:hypothetical protein